MRKWNFCAGPAVISEEVLKEVQSELLEFNDSGMSVMEMSHRSDIYSEVAFEAKKDFVNLLKIPSEYEVLFLQGGATHQFSMIPLNYKHLSGTADYVTTGSWSTKAFDEASKIFDPNEIFRSDKDVYTKVPNIEELKLSKNAAYLHYCPNETIEGVAFHETPKIDIPLIADMSSVILSQPLDINKFSIIYAGAQKNIGPAGLTIVIINKEFMEMGNRNLPNILKYSEHSKSNSMLNTPPTFSWYLAGKVFKWMLNLGGLDYFEAQNKLKASMLYDFIDNSDLYENSIDPNSRSIMNVSFTLKDETKGSLFLEEASNNGLLNLKGHRSVGGMRASIYNAMPVEGVKRLIEFMEHFESKPEYNL